MRLPAIPLIAFGDWVHIEHPACIPEIALSVELFDGETGQIGLEFYAIIAKKQFVQDDY